MKPKSLKTSSSSTKPSSAAPTSPAPAAVPVYLLEFTEQEKRIVLAKYSDYMQALQLIADLHGITGPVVIAPDGSGFLRPPDASSLAPAIQKR
jgi:hypothetical protein